MSEGGSNGVDLVARLNLKHAHEWSELSAKIDSLSDAHARGLASWAIEFQSIRDHLGALQTELRVGLRRDAERLDRAVEQIAERLFVLFRSPVPEDKPAPKRRRKR